MPELNQTSADFTAAIEETKKGYNAPAAAISKKPPLAFAVISRFVSARRLAPLTMGQNRRVVIHAKQVSAATETVLDELVCAAPSESLSAATLPTFCI